MNAGTFDVTNAGGVYSKAWRLNEQFSKRVFLVTTTEENGTYHYKNTKNFNFVTFNKFTVQGFYHSYGFQIFHQKLLR